MPITPHFELSQSVTHVIVEIRVPHVRVSVDSVEIVVDGSTLHFYSSPYLLVLNFSHQLIDNEEENEGMAQYDPIRDGGMIVLSIPKQEPAIWPDLDLMGALMAPKQSIGRRSDIEIVHESTSKGEEQDDNETSESIPDSFDIRNALRPHYGFLDMHSGVFEDLVREGLAAEMLQLPDPDTTPAADRRRLRTKREEADFDVNRYLGDLDVSDDYIYQMAINMVPHWQQETDNLAKQLSNASIMAVNDNDDTTIIRHSFFTPEESAQLASIAYPLLPNSISPRQDESLFLGLLDILFAYVYDHILTDGDPTIESCWTICILSTSLSWLDNHESLQYVVRSSIRRVLIYPYLRNYELALYCWNQVCTILKQKRHVAIRCLLQIHSILKKSESHYLANRLFLNGYLAWMQRHVTDQQVSNLGSELETLLSQVEVLDKASLGLNLVELERQLLQDDSEDESDSESEDESSDEEGTSSSDDETCSSRDVSEDLPSSENSKVTSSTELLDSELGSVSVGIQSLSLGAASAEPSASSSSNKPLIEEL